MGLKIDVVVLLSNVEGSLIYEVLQVAVCARVVDEGALTFRRADSSATGSRMSVDATAFSIIFAAGDGKPCGPPFSARAFSLKKNKAVFIWASS